MYCDGCSKKMPDTSSLSKTTADFINSIKLHQMMMKLELEKMNSDLRLSQIEREMERETFLKNRQEHKMMTKLRENDTSGKTQVDDTFLTTFSYSDGSPSRYPSGSTDIPIYYEQSEPNTRREEENMKRKEAEYKKRIEQIKEEQVLSQARLEKFQKDYKIDLMLMKLREKEALGMSLTNFWRPSWMPYLVVKLQWLF